MTDCKNCNYENEYCASGDCNKIQANNIACNEISSTSQSPRNHLATTSQVSDLTEQWRKGELPEGWYWVDYYSVDGAVMLEYIPQHNGFGYEEKELVQAVLAEVPDYVEWKNMVNCACEEHEANKRLWEENAQLKELLKECREIFDECFSPSAKHGELYKKIDEALK